MASSESFVSSTYSWLPTKIFKVARKTCFFVGVVVVVVDFMKCIILIIFNVTSTVMVIKFRYLLLLGQIFVSVQVKRSVIISKKHNI